MFKRGARVCAVMIAALLAAPVLARTGGPRIGITDDSGSVDAERLIGLSIQNRTDDQTVGAIDCIMVDQRGKIRQVIVSLGGKDVAIDWRQLLVWDQGHKVVINADKEQLQAMPAYVWLQDQAHYSVYTVILSSPTSPGRSNPR